MSKIEQKQKTTDHLEKTEQKQKTNILIKTNKKSKCPKCNSYKYLISFPGPDICCADCDTSYVM